VLDSDGDPFSFPIDSLEEWYNSEFTPDQHKAAMERAGDVEGFDPNKYSKELIDYVTQQVTGRVEFAEGETYSQQEADDIAAVVKAADETRRSDPSISYSQAASLHMLEPIKSRLRKQGWSDQDIGSMYNRYLAKSRELGQSEAMNEREYLEYVFMYGADRKGTFENEGTNTEPPRRGTR